MSSLFDCLLVAFEEWKTHPYNKQILGINDVEDTEVAAGLA